jgi:uncharacterized protein YlzI (FlbEa/FlbD family)
MKPIKVTETNDKKVWVNPNHILRYMGWRNNKTIIVFVRYGDRRVDDLVVQETPDELTRKIVCAN